MLILSKFSTLNIILVKVFVYLNQFSSVAQLCSTLCNPMDCSTPGLPVHHQLPEFTQTHVHLVGDAIQPSHPLSSPSPPAFNLSQHSVFSNESVLCIRWPKYWSFSFSISPSSEYSGQISFRMDWLDLCRRSIQIFYKYLYKYFIKYFNPSNPTSGHTHQGNQI